MFIYCIYCGAENSDDVDLCVNCGEEIIPELTGNLLTPNTVIGNRYQIIGLIKAGGMGAVYKTTDTRLDRVCAVKEMISAEYENPKEHKYAVKRFNTEAKILSSLQHDHLPVVYDYFVENGRYYLVMSFIEGEDLSSILDREGDPYLPEDKVVEWSKQILSVLDYLHNQKTPIIYRDIKPGNIMVRDSDGRAMLIDFGIARAINPDQKTSKTAIGTDGYAPKEQYRGQVEPRSDIYALGATMHHLLTGETPVPLDFEPISVFNPDISPTLEQIVMKALEKEVSDRFANAKEMLIMLSNYKSFPQRHGESSDDVDVFDLQIEEQEMAVEEPYDLFMLDESPSGILPPAEEEPEELEDGVGPGLLMWVGDEDPADVAREAQKVETEQEIAEYKKVFDEFEEDFQRRLQEESQTREAPSMEEYKPKSRTTKIVSDDDAARPIPGYDIPESEYDKHVAGYDKKENNILKQREEEEKYSKEVQKKEDFHGTGKESQKQKTDVKQMAKYTEGDRKEKPFDEEELEIDIKQSVKYFKDSRKEKSFDEDELEIDIKEHQVNKKSVYTGKYDEDDELEVEIREIKPPVKEYKKEVKEENVKEPEVKNGKKEIQPVITEQEELELLVESIDDKPENEEEELIILEDIKYEDRKKLTPDSIELKIGMAKDSVDIYEEQKKNEPIIPLITKKNKVRQRYTKEDDIKVIKKPLSSVPYSYEEELPSTIFHDVDQSEMIYIRPGFSMIGSNDPDDDNPETTMYFYGYYIDKYPVTNFRYNMFLQETGHRKPINWSYSPKNADCPVTCVSWEDASAYAQWCGKRLPTEAEWENAARGTDGRNYPWGYEWDSNNCNNWHTDDPAIVKKMIDISSGRGLTPVTLFLEGVSPYGVMDMVGNVAEWCAEWYEDVRKTEDENDFKYLTFKIYRGGSWRDTDIRAFKTTYRNKAIYNRVFDCIGFRCSMSPKTI